MAVKRVSVCLYEHKSLSLPLCRQVCDHCDVPIRIVSLDGQMTQWSIQNDWFAFVIWLSHLQIPIFYMPFHHLFFQYTLFLMIQLRAIGTVIYFILKQIFFLSFTDEKSYRYRENYKWTVNYFHHLIDLDI